MIVFCFNICFEQSLVNILLAFMFAFDILSLAIIIVFSIN